MNFFSTNNRKQDLMIRITRSRYNMLFIVLMSVINVFLITTGSKLLLPYSSAISNYSIALGISESIISGSDSYRILGLILACAVLMAIMVCYLLSKNKPFYMFVSLSIIVADTLVLAVIDGVNGTLSSPVVILDIVAHGIAIYSIIFGIKAAKELKSLPADEENAPTENSAPRFESYESNEIDEFDTETESIDYESENENTIEEDLSQPIGKYVDDGSDPLVKGVYDGLNVFAIIRDNKAELVVNGFVCDELDVTYLSEFQLVTFVNDIELTFDYKETQSGKIMYLYADNELLDSLGIG